MENSIAKMQTASPLFYVSLTSRSSSSAIISKFRLQNLGYIWVFAATFPQYQDRVEDFMYTDVQAGCAPYNHLQICDNDDFLEGVNMDDVGLTFEKSEDLLSPMLNVIQDSFK
ncbi:hypothetical protein AAC387_Pa07g1711 [Persea americana]